jgi:hypothetical protein
VWTQNGSSDLWFLFWLSWIQPSKTDQSYLLPVLDDDSVDPATLTLKHILSVRCPMCGAKPKEQCTLSTGHPSLKTHLARGIAAAKVSRPENAGQAAARMLKSAASRALCILRQRK